MDRRKFLKNIARGTILTGIGLVIGKSMLNNSKASCNYVYMCKGCNKINDCGLDEAIEYRKKRLVNKV